MSTTTEHPRPARETAGPTPTIDRKPPRDDDGPSICMMSWISWRSIIGGAIASIAIGLVLGLLGVALGFTMVDPMGSRPMAGVGTTFGIWTLISGVVSLAAGGYVAGMFAGQRGCTHGFLVWSLVMLVGAVTTFSTAGMALRAAGSMMGTGASAVATAISAPAGVLAERGVDYLQDRDDSERNDPRIMSILRDTGVEQLQPSFWMGQLANARRDVRSSMQGLNLDNFDSQIDSAMARVKERLDAIRNNRVDREAAINGLMQNRGIYRDQAESLVNEALPLYYYRLDQITTALEQGQGAFEDARVYLRNTVDEARVQAEEATSAAAKSALMASIALILGAIGSMIGGHMGVKRRMYCERL